MSGVDSDSKEPDAGEGRRKEKGVRRRILTKTGLLAVAVAVTLFAALLAGVYICESREPSGAGVSVSRFVDRCLVGLGIRQRRASGMPFGYNLSGLAKALLVYSNDHPQVRLPAGDKWCDVIIQNDFTTLKQFVHRRSDSIEGESDAAMNVNAAGKRLSELPADMVLLFETDFGKERGGRGGLMKDRGFYKVAPCADPNIKVYKKRWNQVGGPEILTTRYNDGQGCNVAFVDTHVEFVKAADLAKLKWKPNPNEK